jgi:hypothetical protein
MVKASDPISEKIVHLVAKYNALDDTILLIKKGFEHEELNLKEFLGTVRQLSMK